MNADDLVIAAELDLSAGEFIDLLRRSTLAERRSVDDVSRIAAMLANSDLVLTARRVATCWVLRDQSPIFTTAATWPTWRWIRSRSTRASVAGCWRRQSVQPVATRFC